MSNNTAGNTTARQLGALRADVDDTTSALKITVDKLVDRQEKLNVLSERADDLSMSSQHFHGSARRVQQRMKWQNYKITIFIGQNLSLFSSRRNEKLVSSL